MADKPDAGVVNGAEPTDRVEAGASSSSDAGTRTEAGAAREMRCVTLTGFGGVRMAKVQTRPEAKPLDGEVLVRVKAWLVR